MNPLLAAGQGDDSLQKALAKLFEGASTQTMSLAGLQGLTSVAGMMAGLGATRAQGRSAKQSAYLSAQDEMANAAQSYVAGQGEVTGLRQALAGALGQRQALAGASGIDAGQGVVRDNARAIAGDAAAEQMTRTNADMLATRHRMNALAQMMRGDAAEREANSLAGAQLGTGLLSGLLSLGKLVFPMAAAL